MNKTQKLFIDVSFLFNPTTGVGAYVKILLNILKKSKKLHLEIFELKLPKWIRYRYIFHNLWQNTFLYMLTILFKPNIIIFPAFIMPYLRRKKTKYITVIHDLAHLRGDEMSQYSKFIFNLSTNIAIKKADIIVTVSETVKNELIHNFNIDPNRVKVVYNSVGEHFKNLKNNSVICKKYNIDEQKYILSVATLNRRKNIPSLIKAFELITERHPEIKLVLVGGMGNEDRKKLSKHPNIIFTGYIPDEDLPYLYKNALLYAFPSLYEGFGIPLIEAQYSNCPVLCSDIPVFREIAGNSAEFFTPDVRGIATKLEYLINNEEKRKELILLGCENVKRFSKEEITEQLLEIIN